QVLELGGDDGSAAAAEAESLEHGAEGSAVRRVEREAGDRPQPAARDRAAEELDARIRRAGEACRERLGSRPRGRRHRAGRGARQSSVECVGPSGSAEYASGEPAWIPSGAPLVSPPPSPFA